MPKIVFKLVDNRVNKHTDKVDVGLVRTEFEKYDLIVLNGKY